mmetsp:Transcript_11832/g.23481  ORF Transcript_11832/g.23481 Transcript_11832/m.23481 type:complete len:269 (+) Transcript_11832:1066-1872(+)
MARSNSMALYSLLARFAKFQNSTEGSVRIALTFFHLSLAAMSVAVSPALSTESTIAPFCTKSLANVGRLYCAAKWSGVLPKCGSVALMFTLWVRSREKTWSWPNWMARCTGLASNCCPMYDGFAPAAKRSLAILSEPLAPQHALSPPPSASSTIPSSSSSLFDDSHPPPPEPLPAPSPPKSVSSVLSCFRVRPAPPVRPKKASRVTKSSELGTQDRSAGKGARSVWETTGRRYLGLRCFFFVGDLRWRRLSPLLPPLFRFCLAALAAA